MDTQKNWDIDQAKCHYRIDRWGMQHFDINSQGNVVVKANESEIDLYEISKVLRNKGTGLPVLVRFPQILQKALDNLSSAFAQAIKVNDYAGNYIAAYPIKVNQQGTVIKHFQQQTQWPIALEVGSKAELIACLGIVDKQKTIICNGYKDETYIRLALMGCLLGHEVIVVLENLTEFQYVLNQSTELGVQPHLGMRVRLSSIAKGNWQNTGGEHSKFGLTAHEVLSLVDKMREHNALDWMQMLHFHMGSQIPSLQDIQSGVQEGMHFFCQLAQHGVNFKQLNIGGGLAVDYEGSASKTYFSMDYSLNDYANTVITTVISSCEKNALVVPTIFSENGRAMTAHHAVLLTNVTNAEYQYIPSKAEYKGLESAAYSSAALNLLIDCIKSIETALGENDLSSFIESYDKLKTTIEKIELEFSSNTLSLSEKAIAEKFINHVYSNITNGKLALPQQELKNIENKFIAKYFCNFSLFQSTPDIWGLNQIFPILPLNRLDEFPAIKSRIYDLTCDSDGRVDMYVEADSVQPYLSLHELNPQKNYILGIFLVGAYQEILGDLHNLFGDTHTVDIVLNTDGSYQICDEEPGDTIAEILSYLHIDTGRMRQTWLDRLTCNNIAGKVKELVLSELESALHANSYLG
jgi:arginine decarboxylase